ncbi:hypothetical protein Tco_0608112 [Tanacetum coccineum]
MNMDVVIGSAMFFTWCDIEDRKEKNDLAFMSAVTKLQQQVAISRCGLAFSVNLNSIKLLVRNERKGIVSRNNYSRVDAKTTHPSVHRNMSPKAVLLKTGLTPLNTVRPVNTALPKSAVHINRHYYTGRPKAVNTARSYTGQVNAVRVKGVNAVKSLAYLVWRPTKPNGASLALKRYNYIDAQGRSNGCSRHMTGNIAYLSDFKEFDGGYVAFGGGAYGGRITDV